MIEEGERASLRCRRQPQGKLRQIHRQRVQIHTIETTLGDAPLPNRQIGLVMRFSGGRDAQFHQKAGDVLHCCDEKMPRTHRRVKTIDRKHRCDLGSVGRLARHRRLQHRAQGLFNDVLDNKVRGVIRTRAVALAFGIHQFDGEAVGGWWARLQMIFQQTLIDRPQMALGEVTIINVLTQARLRIDDARQLIERPLELRVTHAMLHQKRVALRVKQATVEGRHAQRLTALINQTEEIAQPRPGLAGIDEQRHAAIEAFGCIADNRVETVLLTVRSALTTRQQLPRLSVQHKEQAIERGEAVGINGVQGRGRRGQLIRRIIEEALGEMAQRIKDLGLEAGTQRTGIIHTLAQQRIKRERAVGGWVKGRTAKESVEIEERADLMRLDQRLQINLVENILFAGGRLMIEPPTATIGEETPRHTAVQHIESDLAGRHTRERIRLIEARNVQLPLPSLGLTDRESHTAIGIRQRVRRQCLEGQRIAHKEIIGLLRPGGRLERHLEREGMAERF